MTTSAQDQNYFRNPLIGDGIGETQINIQATMSLLKQLHYLGNRIPLLTEATICDHKLIDKPIRMPTQSKCRSYSSCEQGYPQYSGATKQ